VKLCGDDHLAGDIAISYLQDLPPKRVGAASALYGNTGQIGSLLAGFAPEPGPRRSSKTG